MGFSEEKHGSLPDYSHELLIIVNYKKLQRHEYEFVKHSNHGSFAFSSHCDNIAASKQIPSPAWSGYSLNTTVHLGES